MIKGKLVGLRAVEEKDLEKLKEWRNIEGFRENFREFRELSSRDQDNWFKNLEQSKHNNFMFTIVELSNNEPIGACGLLYINWINRSADFSFYIGKNNIYIDDSEISIESTKLVINYGFKDLNLNKIWMELYEFDTRKLKFFMSKFNFKQDGILRKNCFKNGEYFDSIIISLLKSEHN